MALGAEAQVTGYFNVGVGRVYQHIFNQRNFLLHDKIGKRNAFIFSKQHGEVGCTDVQMLSHIMQRNFFMQVGINIIFALF